MRLEELHVLLLEGRAPVVFLLTLDVADHGVTLRPARRAYGADGFDRALPTVEYSLDLSSSR